MLVLLIGGTWAAAWWLGGQAELRGDGGVSTGLVTHEFFDAPGKLCLVGAALWLLFHTASCKKGEAFFESGRSWHFAVRQRQRICEGRPIEPGLLRFYGGFGASGFLLALALALKVAVAIRWQDPILTKGNAVLGPGALALLVLLLSGRLIRDVLFLRDFDFFVGGKAREVAQAMIEEEQHEAKAEREQERKRIRGGACVVLIGGFLGGLWLSSRLFTERDGIAAFQGSVAGLILSAVGVYLLKTRPRGWGFWLVLVSLAAIGFVAFTQIIFARISWGGSPRYQLLGALWGLGVGTTGTVLYLRHLNAKPR